MAGKTEHAHPYEAPKITMIGRVDELTRQNFTNDDSDFNFFGIELTGTS